MIGPTKGRDAPLPAESITTAACAPTTVQSALARRSPSHQDDAGSAPKFLGRAEFERSRMARPERRR